MARRTARMSLLESVDQLRREIDLIRERLDALAAERRGGPVAAAGPEPGASRQDRGGAEMTWLSAHYEIAARHRGEAIAVAGKRVIASGPDMKAVVRLAREAGHPDALYTAIPSDRPKHRL